MSRPVPDACVALVKAFEGLEDGDKTTPLLEPYHDPVGLPTIGYLTTAIFGFVTSFLVLRGTDLTRLMVTLGIAMMIFELANKLGHLTGGADGLQGIVMDPILGVFAFDMLGRTAYVYSLVVLFVMFLIARRLVHSPFGLSIRSIRENPLRAGSLGIDFWGGWPPRCAWRSWPDAAFPTASPTASRRSSTTTRSGCRDSLAGAAAIAVRRRRSFRGGACGRRVSRAFRCRR